MPLAWRITLFRQHCAPTLAILIGSLCCVAGLQNGRADGGRGSYSFYQERLYQTAGVIMADSDLIEMSGLMGV